MDNRQVAIIMKMIKLYYDDCFKEDYDLTYKLWCKDLENVENELVLKNFEKYRFTYRQPPRLSDLVKKQEEESKTSIPSLKDTERYLITLEEEDKYKLSEEKKKSIEERFKAIMKDKPKNEWEMI